MIRSMSTLLVALLAGTLSLYAATQAAPQGSQTKPKPKTAPAVQEPEPEYTDEEYDAYEKATQEKDLDKQGALLTAFMDKYPKSKLQPYIVTGYQTLLYQYKKSENSAKLLSAAETWLKYFPNDLQTIDYATGAAAKLGQDSKFITYGEKVYAVKPTADYAFYIAASYKKLGNEAKYQEWMTKALTYPEYAERAIGFLMEPVDKYAKEKNLAKAAEYARKALDGLQTVKRPAAAPEADWNGKVRAARRGCHYIIGLDLYEKQKYAEAIKKMEAALGLDPHFDMAYYYIGLSQWKLGKVENEEAPLSFAKAYLLKGEVSEQAKEHLEKIYKAIHNNTLINIQKIYDRAKEELATVQRTASNK